MEYRFKTYKKSKPIQEHLKMGGLNAAGEAMDANSLYFTKGGVPWIGVMGEYHYCRDDRDNWRFELDKMKAGGISVVSTYVFWIYHEEEEGIFDFSGNKDIKTFFEYAQEAGLEICLRLGPWVNAECRNGGFPDWLLKKSCEKRSNDPKYLCLVERYWRRLYEEVKDIPLLAIQIENELVDRPEHILALKEMAIAMGFQAPLFTATGWNGSGGAKLPLDEVIPVFGGYPEAPWENHREKLPPSSHFFFNRMRNDADIGADLMPRPCGDGWQLPYERYPFATCEMGGGVQIGLLRRPIIQPMDVYALSLVELGSGNNWLSCYMYHGGSNALGKNTLLNVPYCPIRNYDFQAPVSQYGEIREHYRLLNLLNLFATDFGSVLAPMEMVEAESMAERNDTDSLRYCLRTDGESGFVFVNHYQRLDRLKDIQNAVFRTKSVVFPALDIQGEICFFLPFHLRLGTQTLEYATAQPLCVVDHTYFFVEIPGIRPVYQFTGNSSCSVRAGFDSAFSQSGVNVVTLTWDQAMGARKLQGSLYVCETEDLLERGGRIAAASGNPVFRYRVWREKQFILCSTGDGGRNADKPLAHLNRECCAQPFDIPEEYARYLDRDHPREKAWFRLTADTPHGFVEIDDAFDVGQLYVDGVLTADQFYYGKPWRLPAKMLFGHDCFLVLSKMEDDFYREFDMG